MYFFRILTFIVSLGIMSGCSYYPLVLDINKISGVPETKYAVKKTTTLKMFPIVDERKHLQELGIRENKSGSKKGKLMVSNSPSKKFESDLRLFWDKIGYDSIITELVSDQKISAMKIYFKTFTLDSKKTGLFTHKIKCSFIVTIEFPAKEDKSETKKNYESVLEKKVLFPTKNVLQKTIKDSWFDILDYIANDELFKNYAQAMPQ